MYDSLKNFVLDVRGVRPDPAFYLRARTVLDRISSDAGTVSLLEGYGLVWIQVSYSQDNLITNEEETQRGRLWALFPEMTDDEIMTTVWTAVQASDEYRTREGFRVDGAPIFGSGSAVLNHAKVGERTSRNGYAAMQGIAMEEAIAVHLESRLREVYGSPMQIVHWLEKQTVQGRTLDDWLINRRWDVVEQYLDSIQTSPRPSSR
jgi:hypothetical protein